MGRVVLRVAAVACAVLMLVTACASEANEASVRRVRVDAAHQTGIGPFSNPTIRGSFLAYFPDTVQATPGETIRFERTETGEPHSVAFGRVVDEAFAQDPETLWTIDLDGQTEIPQHLAQPCYTQDGVPPADPREICDQPESPPAFDGSQRWYSSGLIPAEEPFDLEIASDAAPGRYRFYCIFHGPQMSGTLEVVPPGTEVPTQSEMDAAGSEELDALAALGKERVEAEIERYEDLESHGAAGLLLADGRVRVNEFLPFSIDAEVGEPVSWEVNGTHVISFDPPARTEPPAVVKLLSGVVEYKENSVVVRRSPSLPEEPYSEPTFISAEPYDEGTHSSGFLVSETGLVTYEMTFTEPGTQRYRCTIHPDMQGIVAVTL